jgi:hypothetical protein
LEDPDKMRELMTSGAAEEDNSSSIKVILESESWRFISSKACFGIFNKAQEVREYTVKVTEVPDIDMLPPDLKSKY